MKFGTVTVSLSIVSMKNTIWILARCVFFCGEARGGRPLLAGSGTGHIQGRAGCHGPWPSSVCASSKDRNQRGRSQAVATHFDGRIPIREETNLGASTGHRDQWPRACRWLRRQSPGPSRARRVRHPLGRPCEVFRGHPHTPYYLPLPAHVFRWRIRRRHRTHFRFRCSDQSLVNDVAGRASGKLDESLPSHALRSTRSQLGLVTPRCLPLSLPK